MSVLKALKALDVKAWANGPGLGAYVIRSAESAAYVCSRVRTHPAQRSCKGGHIARFQRSVVLASPTRPVGPGYYIWRLRRSIQLLDQVSQICSCRFNGFQTLGWCS